MVIRKTMTNLEIYNLASALLEEFNLAEANYPVKVNFFLQKNINTLVEIARELEENRIAIIKKYGEPDPENEENYVVPQEKMDSASADLEDLFNLEQEVAVNMLDLEWFDNIDMTAKQVSAISFMINEEE